MFVGFKCLNKIEMLVWILFNRLLHASEISYVLHLLSLFYLKKEEEIANFDSNSLHVQLSLYSAIL